ncbi:MAG: lipopolysaccharide heptosyltransferase family protein [Hyphomicrobiales bacterium]|nr:lipopolysaccharide heptosyltransferase family protein [Hyphomicrobiales bacterium]MCP5372085.1 lipopolysaccharide heptosyltransferase family protein [Hyphomicrobiales bacterium]
MSDALDQRRRRARDRGLGKGLLLITSGGLGDTVMFALVLPRFRRLAEPGEPVTVLLRRDAAKMAFLFPDDVTVETVDYGRLLKDRAYRRQVGDRLYAAHFRLVVTTDYLRHPLLDEALVRACATEAWAMVARPWPKHDAALARNRALYTRQFESGQARRDKIVRWNDFADWLLGEAAPPPVVRLDPAGLAPPADLGAPTVVIQPYSAVRAKQSPAALYARLIAALPAGVQVRITGSPRDRESDPDIAALCEMPGVTFDDSPFADLVPVLRAARLVVSVDTALMHLAVAVGAPTLCLASAAYVGEIVPYAPEVTPGNVRFLFTPMDCAGCLGDCRLPAEAGMYPCVARLDGDAVVATALEMLDR